LQEATEYAGDMNLPDDLMVQMNRHAKVDNLWKLAKLLCKDYALVSVKLSTSPLPAIAPQDSVDLVCHLGSYTFPSWHQDVATDEEAEREAEEDVDW